MKRIIGFVSLIVLLFFPISIKAAGNISVSPSSITVEKGKSANITISAYNTIGDVSISSSNTSIATVSAASWGTGMVEANQTKKGVIKVKGISVGTTTIIMKLDAATFDGGDLAGQTRVVNVTVKEPVVYSSNNTIKDISVDGYELTKIDNNNYELMVNNEVETIKVNATAEDEKARVSGTGNVTLQIGVNNLQVVVTAENGAQNVINLKVTRKDGYYLEDLSSVINKDEEVVILLTDNSKITSEHLETIKGSKKKVTFNYVNENKVVMYSWVVDGKNLSKIKEINTKITFGSENINDIGAASNYAEGKHVNFEHTGELPDSTQVRLYVADKFSNGDIINVYSYDKDGKKLTSVQKALEVKDGYISFDIENCAEYFITRSNVMDVVEEKKGINVFLIISVVELLVIVGLVVMLIIKSKKIDSEVGIKPSEVQPVVNEAVVAEPQIPAPTTPITEVRVEQNVTITENTIDNNIQNQ